MNKQPISVAIIDLYDNEPNQGMRCIKELIHSCDRKVNDIPVSFKVYETRYKGEIPGLEHDIYISSGGPGSPFDGEGKSWEKNYFKLLDFVWSHNQLSPELKKHVFFICHSFQMMCRYFDLATIQQRQKRSFGILPVKKTEAGNVDVLLKHLPETYYAADFRQFEVVQPREKQLADIGAEVLSVEKQRVDPTQEKALMAVRVSDEFVGTQFHPEADPKSMYFHFRQPERKEQVVAEYGEEKYYRMIDHLEDPTSILLTRQMVLPKFLLGAISKLRPDGSARGTFLN